MSQPKQLKLGAFIRGTGHHRSTLGIALATLLGLIGFALNSLANALGRRLVPWRQ
jgi:ABC-type nitrate/sulfonate/bicarbonate transport system permease component